MAWNGSGSDNNVKATVPNGVARSRRRYQRGIAAGMIVLLVGVFVALIMTVGKDEAEKSKGDKPQHSVIAEVKPQIVATNNNGVLQETKKRPFGELSREEQLKYYRDKYGDNIPDNLKNVVYFLEHPAQRDFKMPKSRYACFRHPSERSIAGLVNMQPGHWMMRVPTYDERFDHDFVESLLDPVKIEDGDTDEERELKQSVIDAKKELAERIKQGERASDIMNETAQQLYQLGQYKRDLENELRNIRNDETASDEDYQLAVEAANKILESKGLPPMRMPNMVMRHVGLQQKALKNTNPRKEK